MKQQLYTFFPSEAGVLVEIYLPKRAILQGALYDTLTKGFNITTIKEHFLNKEKKEHIKELLIEHYPEIANYDSDKLNTHRLKSVGLNKVLKARIRVKRPVKIQF